VVHNWFVAMEIAAHLSPNRPMTIFLKLLGAGPTDYSERWTVGQRHRCSAQMYVTAHQNRSDRETVRSSSVKQRAPGSMR